MCVNLPIEFDLKRMSDLIGFDTKKRRYALFTIHNTSSSLSKLQNYSEKRSKEKKRRDRERGRRRDRKRKELVRSEHHRKDISSRSRTRSRSDDRMRSKSKSVSMSPSRITNIEVNKVENNGVNGGGADVVSDLKEDKQEQPQNNECLEEKMEVDDAGNGIADAQGDEKK